MKSGRFSTAAKCSGAVPSAVARPALRMTSFMVLMETLVGSVSIAVGGCGAAGSIAVLAPARAAREYAARRMRLGPVLLDAERLSFARAQRTDATQHFAVLCHLHSAPMGEF